MVLVGCHVGFLCCCCDGVVLIVFSVVGVVSGGFSLFMMVMFEGRRGVVGRVSFLCADVCGVEIGG